MTPSRRAAVRPLREGVANALAPLALAEPCRGRNVRRRHRALDPVPPIHVFLLRILHGNTACAHLPRLTGRSVTAAAPRQARGRLPLAVLRSVTAALWPAVDADGLWRAHRTGFVAGTGVSLPDTPPLQRAFGPPTNPAAGCGFPVARALALFHAGPGPLQAFLTAPLRSHEIATVTQPHPDLRAGDVLVGDRAFEAYARPYFLAQNGLHGVFRVSRRRVVDFTPGRTPPPRWSTRKVSGKARSRWVRNLGPTDPVVEWYKPDQRPTWMTAEAYAPRPVTLAVRETRYAVDRPGFRASTVTPVSTPLDAPAYPAAGPAGLYRQRWQVGTDLAHLKTTPGMGVRRCETEAGVREELVAFAIADNLVRAVLLGAGRRQDVPWRGSASWTRRGG
ncbi:transposase [Limnoglobus roseus]|uniref:transposase n=1 Tax=Limnoglobus roseus TaxID=2598579 RepID=UPI001FEBAFEA|nr:transposase [Limnoglobus roseus]